MSKPLLTSFLIKGGRKVAFTLAEGASHGAVFNSQRKIAFTLAEVLITLGIIGIVAAMTMPALIQNYKRKEATGRLKKMYSMVAQAITLSEVDNGSVIYWNKPAMIGETSPDNKAANRNLALSTFNTYFKPYLKYVKVDTNPKVVHDADGEAGMILVYLADGSAIGFRNGACIDIRMFLFGDKSKTYGKDIFNYLVCTSKSISDAWFGNNKYFGPYGLQNYPTRESAKTGCKSYPELCAVLLMYDGFEFKDDYPHKL